MSDYDYNDYMDDMYPRFDPWSGAPTRSYRDTWREKSDAAQAREDHAKKLFDAFFERCKTATSFPITEEIVPAEIHLTHACWASFRRHVLATGCNVKRREATAEERGKDRRKGNMYVISVTCPNEPSKLQDIVKKRAEQAIKQQAAREKRAEEKKKREEEEERIRIQKHEAHRDAVEQEYKTLTEGEELVPQTSEDEIVVTAEDLIQHAKDVYGNNCARIRYAAYNRKRGLEQTLAQIDNKRQRIQQEIAKTDKECQRAVDEARKEYERIESLIDKAKPREKPHWSSLCLGVLSSGWDKNLNSKTEGTITVDTIIQLDE